MVKDDTNQTLEQGDQMIRIGSLFSGIGGFELGLERAIPNSTTLWQVEQDKFCQRILQKHWKDATIYDDVRTIHKHNVAPIDILCGGFPCQDISIAGNGKGIIKNETRSGLWWEMHRIINELQPRVAVLENVPAITFRGGLDVIGSLAQIGYDAEWIVISAQQFGAPHKRERWFCIAYPHSDNKGIEKKERASDIIGTKKPTAIHTDNQGWIEPTIFNNRCHSIPPNVAYPNSERLEKESHITKRVESKGKGIQSMPTCTTDSESKNATDTNSQTTSNTTTSSSSLEKKNTTQQRMPIRCDHCYGQQYSTSTGYWRSAHPEPLIRRVDDGLSRRLDNPRLKALGNAIVPQCSEWIGKQIWESGLL